MLIDFFYTLRAAKLPVSVKEFLTLLEALKLGVVGPKAVSYTHLDVYKRQSGGRWQAASWRDNYTTMFSPTQADVRRFFCSIYAKTQTGQALNAIEKIASVWTDEHPEYHAEPADQDAALANMAKPEDGNSNAFLHLSMHLSLIHI